MEYLGEVFIFSFNIIFNIMVLVNGIVDIIVFMI